MDILAFPFKLMLLGRQDTNSVHIVSTVVQSLIMGSVAFLGILIPILTGGENWGLALDAVGPSFQWFNKMVTYKWHRKALQQALKETSEKFWPINMFGEVVEKKIIMIYRTINVIFHVYIYTAIAIEIIMILRALFTITSTKELPVYIYPFVDFTAHPYYELGFILTTMQLYLNIVFLCASDGLFYVLLIGPACQLKLLGEALRNIKTENSKDVDTSLIKKYVDHHNYILDYITDVQKIMSLYLINQLIASTLSLCIPSYLFTTGVAEANLFFITTSALYGIAAGLQIFLYSACGSHIKNEIGSIADAVYESDWWKSGNPQLKQATLLIMQRSQIADGMRAGGMLNLDLNTFIGVLKMSFSFFSLMQMQSK